jgi:hypothetical protein
VIWECGLAAVSRPRELTVACADGNTTLAELRWKQWGFQNATATGVEGANLCEPSCNVGHWVHFPVRVIASQLVLGEQFAAYGALTIDAVGTPPAGVFGHYNLALDTSGPGGRS